MVFISVNVIIKSWVSFLHALIIFLILLHFFSLFWTVSLFFITLNIFFTFFIINIFFLFEILFPLLFLLFILILWFLNLFFISSKDLEISNNDSKPRQRWFIINISISFISFISLKDNIYLISYNNSSKNRKILFDKFCISKK